MILLSLKEGTEENLVANGDFAQNATAGWGSNWQGPTFKCEKIGGGIPLSDKEKKEVLTTALDKWIAGMMEATEGKVKAWDVVNEALSGADTDGDGKYDLAVCNSWLLPQKLIAEQLLLAGLSRRPRLCSHSRG